MSLSANFNSSGYTASRVNDYVLGVTYPYSEGSTYLTYHTFDFLARILTTRTGDSAGGGAVIPFSQLDPDSLETLRQRLVDLGGHPPELTARDAIHSPKSGRGLNP